MEHYPERIFLVGYMGSGKSTLGKKLAEHLQYHFIDTDATLEKRLGQKIPTIFRKFGEEYWRKKEHELLTSFSSLKNIVISTGGGMPVYQNNMNILLELGQCVYLDISLINLVLRLSKSNIKRPLIGNKSGAVLRDFVNHQLEQRTPYYNLAQIKLSEEDISIKRIAELLKL